MNFRKFIKGFALIAKLLCDLLKRNANFNFGKDETAAFENLKRKFVETPILTIYDPNDITELHYNASTSGVGAALF